MSDFGKFLFIYLGVLAIIGAAIIGTFSVTTAFIEIVMLVAAVFVIDKMMMRGYSGCAFFIVSSGIVSVLEPTPDFIGGIIFLSIIVGGLNLLLNHFLVTDTRYLRELARANKSRKNGDVPLSGVVFHGETVGQEMHIKKNQPTQYLRGRIVPKEELR